MISAEIARNDYANFLKEIGMTDIDVRADMDKCGFIPVEESIQELDIRDSAIDGLGCFAKKKYRSGDCVCSVRLDSKKTACGRFINHSINPNVKYVWVGDDVCAFASDNIEIGDEILVDYRQSYADSGTKQNSDFIVDGDDSNARSIAKSLDVEHLQTWLSSLPQVSDDLTHKISGGIYVRKSVIGPGCIFTTETHKQEHQFVLSEGSALVWSKQDGWKFFKAPLIGTTFVGTRRVVVTLEKCVMTTFHHVRDEWQTIDQVWDNIYVKRDPPPHMSIDDVERVGRFTFDLGESLKNFRLEDFTSLPKLMEQK